MIQKKLPHSLKTKDAKKPDCMILHESKDLAACSSVAVALGKFKLPRLEPAHGLHLLEAPYVKKKQARRCGFTQNDPKMGSQNFKKILTSKHIKMT